MISVIVPVYNVEKYIERCLNSVITQTVTDFELLVIDDGSTDDSMKIAENILGGSDLNYRFIRTENRGVSAARNLGIEEAKGEYITFLDSDDYISSDYIASYEQAIRQNPKADVLFSNYCILKGASRYDNRLGIEAVHEMNAAEAQIKFYHRELKFLITAMALRKEYVISGNLRFDSAIRYSEDLHYIWRVLAYTENPIIVLNKTVYFYIIREGSTMTSSGIEKILTGCEGFQKLEKEIGHRLCGKVKRDFVGCWYISMLHGAAKMLSEKDWKELFRRSQAEKYIKQIKIFSDMKISVLLLISSISRTALYSVMKRF